MDAQQNCLLYEFTCSDFPPFVFFKTRTSGFHNRLEDLLRQYKINVIERDRISERLVSLGGSIRIVVLGEKRWKVTAKDIVGRKCSEVRKSVSLLDLITKGFGGQLDFFVLPITGSVSEDFDYLSALQIIVSPPTFEKILIVSLSDRSGRAPVRVIHQHLHDAVTTATEPFKKCTFVPKAGISQVIHDSLESKALDVVLMMSECLGRIFKQSYETPVERIILHYVDIGTRNAVSQMISCKEYLNQWALELKRCDADRTMQSKWKPVHDDLNHDQEFPQCLTCILLHQMVQTLSKQLYCVLLSILKFQMKGEWSYFPGKIEIINLNKVFVERTSSILTDSLGSHLSKQHNSRKGQLSSRRDTDSEDYNKTYMKSCISKVHFLLLKMKSVLEQTAVEAAKSFVMDICQKAKVGWTEDVDRLAWEMNRLFTHSEIHRFQILAEPEQVLPALVRKTIFEQIPIVRGCGYCFGKLVVNVEKNAFEQNSEALTSLIQEFFKKHGIYHFAIKPVSGPVKKFKFSVGDEIKTTTPVLNDNAFVHYGTLGGFANMESTDAASRKPTTLCALVSDHLVSNADHISLVINRQQNITVEIGTRVPAAKADGQFDIAAVELRSNLVRKPGFKTNFRNSQGDLRPCRLFDDDCTPASGAKVHIWGAKSKPGQGVVASIKYDFKISSSSSPRTYILIADEKSDPTNQKPFCEPGDSGSIVCADTRRDEHVEVLSMLIGQCLEVDVNNMYMTFVLKQGLDDLSERAGKIFTICGEAT